MKNFLYISLFFLSLASVVYAANPGGIDGTYKYAEILDGDYAGSQINFSPNLNNSIYSIAIYNDRMTGYAWGEATGYIIFSCENTTSGCSATNGNFKVANDGNGNLSGYAWGSLTGWISFSCSNNNNCNGGAGNWGVSILPSGEFSGHAWSQNFGYIKFDCSSATSCLKTDWNHPAGSSGGSSGGATIVFPSTTTGSGTTTGTGTTTTGTTSGTTTGTGSTTGTSTGTTGTTTTGGTGSTTGTTTGTTGTTTGTTGTTGTTAGTTGFTTGSIGSSTGSSAGSTGGSSFGGTGSFPSSVTTPVYNGISKGANSFMEKTAPSEKMIAIADAVADVIPVAGVVAGMIAALSSLFFVNAVSFSELIFLPARIWSSLLMFFGIAKKPWGIVYDSLTKQPIDPAYVTLIDAITGEEVASSLTDINGRYGFDNIKKGRYRIEASKTHYKFPSLYLVNKSSDSIYEDLYFGQEFDVLEDGALITKNIPIDSESVDWNEVAKKEQNLMSFNPIRESRWQKIAHFIFIVGFIGSILFMINNPTKLNKISLIFYIVASIVMYIARIPKIRAMLSRSHAIVVESNSDKPVPFAMVEIKNPETGVVVTKRVTNQDGLFYALVEKGHYTVSISKQDKIDEYTKVFESQPTIVKKGFISSKFEV